MTTAHAAPPLASRLYTSPADHRRESPDDRRFRREAITEHLLTALEDVVWRYRALATNGASADLYAEVVTAEVAHQLEVARNALHRLPSVH